MCLWSTKWCFISIIQIPADLGHGEVNNFSLKKNKECREK